MKRLKGVFVLIAALLSSLLILAACGGGTENGGGGTPSDRPDTGDVAADSFIQTVADLPSVSLEKEFYSMLDVARFEYNQLTDASKEKAKEACGVFLAKDAQYFILLVADVGEGESVSIGRINDAEIYYEYKLIAANKDQVTEYKGTLDAKKAAYLARFDSARATLESYLDSIGSLGVTETSKGGVLDSALGFAKSAETFYAGLSAEQKKETVELYAQIVAVKLTAEKAVSAEALAFRRTFETIDFNDKIRGKALDEAYLTLKALKDSTFSNLSAAAVTYLNANGDFAVLIQAKLDCIGEAAVYERNELTDVAFGIKKALKGETDHSLDEIDEMFKTFDKLLSGVSKITGGALAGGTQGGVFGQYEADLTACRDMLYDDAANGFAAGVSCFTEYDGNVTAAAEQFQTETETVLGAYFSGGALTADTVKGPEIDSADEKLTALGEAYDALDNVTRVRFAEENRKTPQTLRGELNALAAAEAEAFVTAVEGIKPDFAGLTTAEEKQTEITDLYRAALAQKANYGDQTTETAAAPLADYTKTLALESGATAAEAKAALDETYALILSLPYDFELSQSVYYAKSSYENAATQGMMYLKGIVKNVEGKAIAAPAGLTAENKTAGAPLGVSVDESGLVKTDGVSFSMMPVTSTDAAQHPDDAKIYFYGTSYMLAQNTQATVGVSCDLTGGEAMNFEATLTAKLALPVITNQNDGISLNADKNEITDFKAGNDSASAEFRGGAYSKVRAYIYPEGTFVYKQSSDIYSTLVPEDAQPIAYIEKTVWNNGVKSAFTLKTGEIKKAIAKSEWFKETAGDAGRAALKVEIGLVALSELSDFADSQMVTNACTTKEFTENLGELTVTVEDGYERPELYTGSGTGVFNVANNGAFEFFRGAGCFAKYDEDGVLGVRFNIYDDTGAIKGSFYYKRGGGDTAIYTGLTAADGKLSKTIANTWSNDGYLLQPGVNDLLKETIDGSAAAGEEFCVGTKTLLYSYQIIHNPDSDMYEADSYESEKKSVSFTFG